MQHFFFLTILKSHAITYITKQKGNKMKDKKILNKIKEWLDANIEEHDISSELRLDNARLRDKIEEWEKEQ